MYDGQAKLSRIFCTWLTLAAVESAVHLQQIRCFPLVAEKNDYDFIQKLKDTRAARCPWAP